MNNEPIGAATNTAKPFHDCMDYSATIAASETAKGLGLKPATLGLAPLNFINRDYEDADGKIDPRRAIRLGEKLNPNAPIVIDDEVRLGRMFTTIGGTYAPAPMKQRNTPRRELVELVRCLVASPNGELAASQGLGFYQGIIGAGHPENGGTWWTDWGATNRVVFGKRRWDYQSNCVQHADSLAEATTRPVVSAYVAYNSDRLEAERLRRAMAMSFEIYGTAPLVFVGLRYPSGYEEAERRFDFVRGEHMARALETVYPHAFGIVLWTWNGYGPEGYRGRRDGNGYPIDISGARGAGWDNNLPAWKAVEKFRTKIVNDTMNVRDIKPLFKNDGGRPL